MLDRKEGWLKQLFPAPAKKGAAGERKDPEDLVRQAYLRTLSRLPDERETAVAMRYLHEASDAASGLRDLMWALLNTKEFIVNR